MPQCSWTSHSNLRYDKGFALVQREILKKFSRTPQLLWTGIAQILGIFRGLSPKNHEFCGCFGDRESPNFGDEDGDRALQKVWGSLGTGTYQILRIYWGSSPKIPKFRGWGWGYSSKNVWGCFGDGEPPNFVDIWGKIPENPQISEWGRGKESWGFLPHY